MQYYAFLYICNISHYKIIHDDDDDDDDDDNNDDYDDEEIKTMT